MTKKAHPVVLYVEDNPASRRIVRMLLQNRLKYEHVTIFQNSDDFEARVLALEPIPDIIFLDIHLKPLDGFEMLKVLRGLAPFEKTKIVALTASVMNNEVEQLRSAGFDGCFSKPIDLDTFEDNLHRALAGENIWEIVG